MEGSARRAFADAIKIRRRADEELAVGDRHRAQAVIVERVLGQDFKLRPRLVNGRQPLFARDVYLSVCKDGRGAVGTGLQSLPAVNLGAGLGVQAPGDAAVADAV